ncbi:riboflavin synthase subunit beta [Nonlabens ponticola]|uniref:Riboflavin synthase subunit beta n=1 Tax=Nonlabens ponticola TaxID=2496866 RepID=A0A3S9MXV8_9FLAO|nr:riboflavin synthase subunit beta [Nonlabens ponticola]AZQ43969.1 riboflavin synthase subunit beta [Nonlabens ponticola]
MGVLRRKNKKYDYEPRYYKSEEGSKPFEIKHKFDDQRTTVNRLGLKGKFNNAMRDYKEGTDALARKRIYIIVAVLVFLFLWLIDFDLSIFSF